jgi:hypothetical protein
MLIVDNEMYIELSAYDSVRREVLYNILLNEVWNNFLV